MIKDITTLLEYIKKLENDNKILKKILKQEEITFEEIKGR